MKPSGDGLAGPVGGPEGALKIELEPLSEARWARVERAVLDAGIADVSGQRPTQEPVTRWRPAPGLLVLAGALAAIAGGFAWRAMLPEAHGGATRVQTAAQGSRVEFGESTIDVGPTSEVRLEGDDAHGVVVTLDTGRVECDVTPRHGRAPFVVEAGSVEVRVVGTHFVVARSAEGVAVDVQRGQVEVTANGRQTLVSAGAHWPAALPLSSEAPPAGSSAAPVAPAPAAGHPGPVEPRTAAVAAPRGVGPLSPRDQYEAASRLEAEQPAAAIALYRELAHQGGAWGANALFAAGRLETDRGDQNEARRLLHEYLVRYPTGPNANDARQLLDRLR
jgi:hypothetical protein